MGITEETDAVVVVISEESASISVVMGGEMIQGLDAPRLRVVLHDILAGERTNLADPVESSGNAGVTAEGAGLAGAPRPGR